MLGRVISFGDAAYITDTISLQCTNVLGTIVLERVINLGGTTDTTTRVKPSAKICPIQSC
jgi:hypothetical protein